VRKGIVHPDMLTHLSRFYPATCTVRHYTAESPDTYGQPQPTWGDFSGHVNLSCSVAPSGGREIKRADMEIAISTHTIALAGSYPDITAKMQAVVGAETYDILLVEVDSHSKMTRLTTQVVT